ncbi:MAG: hypothetical protein GVY19_00300 [Bacteroidetes bacterium]|jgi:cellobiose phosphorylase|nr:hypothetical protein [Bacteroidota bacterium]
MADSRNDINSYYEFNDDKREITINRYDTPVPWMNYLSNGTFHTMMSQAGGALAFYRSPQIWRINRYRFFHLPTDRSGMYMYIKDQANGDYWCPTAEPALLKPEQWKAYHGLGYTGFEAQHNLLSANLEYIIGQQENNLIWHLNLTNKGTETKNLQLFAFVEFGMMEFLREISWVCYMKHQMSAWFEQDPAAIIFKYGVETQPRPDETPLIYLASDYPLKGFDCDRDEFVGNYRSETNPFALENDGCTQSTLFGGDPCGAMEMEVELKPGETKTLNVFLGAGQNIESIKESLKNARSKDYYQHAKKDVQKYWNTILQSFQCKIPDAESQRSINIWNPYQVERNIQFSRNISYYATGTFRGVGFRDTAQDVIAMASLDVKKAKEKARLLLSQQYQDGHVNHYFFPVEGWEPINRLHSDNHLWPVLSIWQIVMEEGKADFLDEKIPFYDGGEDTVYGHLKRSIAFTQAHIGERGMPLMLHSDWNDQLFKVCREGKGESVWTAMQLGIVLNKLAELALLLKHENDAEEFNQLYQEQKKIVNYIAWDGQWYRRAIMDSGQFLGTIDNEQAKIWLNAQSWSIISGFADEKRGIQAMDTVKESLDTPLGIKILTPPITDFPDPKDPLTHYNKGTGENAAIFCHANTWAVIAECMLGRGDQAWKYYRQLIPSVAMQEAGPWRYKSEPYVYCSNLFGPDSDKFGLANVSWLTGTASWMYIAATRYILGVQPVWNGLKITPCLPSHWKEVEINRYFRGTNYHIRMVQTNNQQEPVLTVDGKQVAGDIIPEVQHENCKVEVKF